MLSHLSVSINLYKPILSVIFNKNSLFAWRNDFHFLQKTLISSSFPNVQLFVVYHILANIVVYYQYSLNHISYCGIAESELRFYDSFSQVDRFVSKKIISVVFLVFYPHVSDLLRMFYYGFRQPNIYGLCKRFAPKKKY